MMTDERIVHSEWLDDYSLLEVLYEETPDPNNYRVRISWFDENGEYFGMTGTGQFYMTKAEAIAAGHIEHHMDKRD